ncbi:uL15 family ribosomal protein [Patescibacteria group bacterium]|nr:uL15 family ribosomal protein [Patescibacteria group bacterium]
MQIHNVQPKTKQKSRVRVGRGGKRGTYSGKGMKGQTARAGARVRPAVRDLIKQIHKLRGYEARSRRTAITLSLRILEEAFAANETVSPRTVREKGLVANTVDRKTPLKILNTGELHKALIISGIAVSRTAEEKIRKAGGSIEQATKTK